MKWLLITTIGTLSLLGALTASSYSVPTQSAQTQTPTSNLADKIAIHQVVRKMQDGQNTRNGNLYASAFAPEHDYIVIDGTFIPNYTQKDNARIHQQLYDGAESSLGGNLGAVKMQLEIAKIRFLTPEIAIVHIQSQAGLRNQPGKWAKNIISTVMQKQTGKWEIIAFHNAPVQKQEGDDFGFAIDLQGFENGKTDR